MNELLKEKLISTKDASALSGYTSDYLSRLCREGKIEGTQVGRTWLVDRDSLEKFIAAQIDRKVELAESLAREREREYRLSSAKPLSMTRSMEQRTQAAVNSVMAAFAKTRLPQGMPVFPSTAVAMALTALILGGSAAAAGSGIIAKAGSVLASSALEVRAQMVGGLATFAYESSLQRNELVHAAKSELALQENAVSNIPALRIDDVPASLASALSEAHAPVVPVEIAFERAAAVANAHTRNASFAEVAENATGALTNPSKTVADAGATTMRTYASIGVLALRDIETVQHAYRASIIAAGEGLLALSVGTRDVTRIAPLAIGNLFIDASDATFELYERGIYGFVAASQATPEAVVGIALDSGSVVGGLAHYVVSESPKAYQGAVASFADKTASAGTKLSDHSYAFGIGSRNTVAGLLRAQDRAIAGFFNSTKATLAGASESRATGAAAQGVSSIPSIITNETLGFVGNVALSIENLEDNLLTASPLAALNLDAFVPGFLKNATAVLARAFDSALHGILGPLAGFFGAGEEAGIAIIPGNGTNIPGPGDSTADESSVVYNGPVTIIRNEYPTVTYGGVPQSYVDERLEFLRRTLYNRIEDVVDDDDVGITSLDGMTGNDMTLNNPSIVGGTITGSTLDVASTTVTGSLTVNGDTSISGTLTTGDLVATNATTTNFYATAGTFASATIDALTAPSAFITNLIATNSTTTNATTTNLYVSSLTGLLATITDAFFTNVTASLATLTDAVITTLTATNATLTNATSTNATTTNSLALTYVTPSRLLSVDAFGKVIATNLVSWVTGTSNQITVTDTGAGGIQLSLPNTIVLGTTSPTTIASGGATSTFAGGIYAPRIEASEYIAGPYVLATSTTATSAFSGNIAIGRNATLGTGASDTLVVNATVGSNFTPSLNNAYDLGSAANNWRRIYVDEVIANNLSAASTSIAGTVSSDFTINSDNASNDTEDMNLVFNRGVASPNAILAWNSATKRFEFNMPVFSADGIFTNATTTNFAVTNFGLGGEIFTSLLGNGLVNSGGVLSVSTSSLATGFFQQGGNSFGTAAILGTNDNNPLAFETNGTERMRILANGNVGIGTTNPQGRLDIAASGTGTTIQRWTDSGNGIGAYMYQGATADDIRFYLNAAGADTVRISSSLSSYFNGGNVGIGTTSPNYRLTVGSGATNDYIQILTGDTNTGGLLFADLLGVNPGAIFYSHATNQLSFRTNSVDDRMVITSAGNVGIGTNAPNTILSFDVPWSGSSEVITPLISSQTGASTLTSIDNVTESAASSNVGLRLRTMSLGVLAERLRVTSAGNVGIGTSSPAARLTVLGQGTGSAQIGSTGFGGNYTGISLSGSLNTTNYNFLSSATNPLLWINRPTGGDIEFKENNVAQAVLKATTGYFGIGTTTPSNKLHVVGTSDVLRLSNTNASGFVSQEFEAGTTVQGRIYGIGSSYASSGRFQASSLLVEATGTGGLGLSAGSTAPIRFYTGTTEKMTILSGGNVGIGATSPSTLLHMSGSVPVIRLTDTDLSAYSQVNADGTTGSIRLQADDGNAVAGSFVGFNVDGTERMRVDSSGNVGIGTTTPASALSVAGAGFQQVEVSNYGSSNQAGGFLATNNTGRTLRTGVFGSTFGIATAANNAFLAASASTDLLFGTGNFTELMRLTSAGNVGIGTSTPNAQLEVYSTGLSSIRITGGLLNTHPALTLLDEEPGGAQWNIENGREADGTLGFYKGGTRMVIDTNGNVGIGTTSPSAKLDVWGDANIGNGDATPTLAIGNISNITNDATLYMRTTGNAVLLTANGATFALRDASANERLTVKMATGNVGIGTTSPSQLLSVAGDVYFTGGLGLGITNTTDGSLRMQQGAGTTWGGGNIPQLYVENNGSSASFYAFGISTGAGNSFAVTNAGNVGIGTSTPQENFVVGGTRPLSYSSSLGALSIQANAGGWANAFQFKGSAGTALGGFGANGSNDSLTRYYIGTFNTDEKVSIRANGNVGIGTTSPLGKLHLASSNTGNTSVATANGLVLENSSSNLLTFLGDTGETAVQGLYFADDDNNEGRLTYTHSDDSMRFWTTDTERLTILGNGNIGIGTVSPSQLFSVGSTNQFTVTSAGAVSALSYNINNTGSAVGNGMFAPTGNTVAFSTNSSERLRIDSSGNIGIGTTSPSALLSVAGNSLTSGTGTFGQIIDLGLTADTLTYADSSKQLASVTLGNALTLTSGTLAVSTTSLATGFFQQNGNSFGTTAVLGTNDSQSLQFETGGTTRLTIDTSGNVGIGTTTPSLFKLQVAGNIGPDATGTYNLGSASARFQTLYVNGILANGAAGSDSRYELAGGNLLLDNTYSLRFKDNGGTGFSALSVTSANNVQFSTPTSGGSMQFNVANASGAIQFLTNGTERIRVTNAGNVGIGTTTPGSLLTVAGNAYFTGTLAVDGALTLSPTATSTIGGNSYGPDGIVLGSTDRINSPDNFNIYDTSVGISRFLFSTNNTYNVRSTGSHLFQINGTQVAIIDVNGRLGVGDSTPDFRTEIQGTSGSGYFAITNATDGDILTVNGSGNVGIGIASPTNTLTVASSTTGAGITVRNGTNNIARLVGYETANDGGTLELWNGGSIATLIRSTGNSYFQGGNLGIGTASPSSKLHVVGSAGALPVIDGNTRLLVQDNSTTGTSAGVSIIAGNASDFAVLNFGDADSENPGRIQYSNASNFMAFRTNGADRVRIDASGNVGIGTTSPSYRLTVVNSASTIASIFQGNGGNNALGIGTLSSGPFIQGYSNTNAAGTVNLLLQPSGGNVGIGTTTPGALLTLSSTDPRVRLQDTDAGGEQWDIQAGVSGLFFNRDGVSDLTLSQSGNVGIGTTNPTSPLEIGAGFIEIANDGGLRSDVSGTQRSIIQRTNTSEIRIGDSAGWGSMTFYPGTGSEAARFTSLGNFGIGASDPTAKLVIRGGSLATGGSGLSFSSNLGTGRLTTGQVGSIHTFADNESVEISAGSSQPTGFAIDGQTSSLGSTIRAVTGGSERLRITAAGNVGIGTSNPQAGLSLGSTVAGSGIVINQTVDDVTNYSRGRFYYDGSTFTLRTEKAGSGVDTPLRIYPSNGIANIYLSALGTDANTGFVQIGSGNNTQNRISVNLGVGSHGASVGTQTQVAIQPTIAQSSTANYIALSIKPTESSLGSGSNYLFQAGTSTAPGLFSITNTGNVGIGTAAPVGKLDVVGNILSRGSAVSYTGITNAGVLNYDTVGGVLDLAAYSTGGNTSLRFTTSNAGTPATRMTITNAGDVGIGTTSPTERLAVTGEGSGVALIGDTGIGNGYTGLSLNGTLTAGTYNLMGGVTQSHLWINRKTGGDIFFRENNVDQFIIKATTGNVGIGTTTPNQKLVVAGNGTFANTSTGATQLRLSNVGSGVSAGFLADDGGGAEIFSLTRQASNTLSITSFNNIGFAGGALSGPSTSYQMLIDGVTGNVGIGTSTPDRKLVITDTSSSILKLNTTNSPGNYYTELVNSFDAAQPFYIYSSQTGKIFGTKTSIGGDGNRATYLSNFYSLAFATGSADPTASDVRMFINQAGNVGIGTTNPGASLDVLSGTDYGQILLTRTKTTATDQRVGISAQHYTASEEPVGMLSMLNTSSANRLLIGGGYAAANSATSLEFFTGGTNTTLGGTARMTINSTGNVGIGTANPASKLDVIHGATYGIVARQVDGGNYANFGAGTSYAYLGFNNSFGVDGLTINSAGNVGIGTTNPLTKLTVSEGSILVNSTSNDAGVVMGSGNSYGTIYAVNAANSTLKSLILQEYGGNVGIGTTSPVATFGTTVHVAGATGGSTRYSGSSVTGYSGVLNGLGMYIGTITNSPLTFTTNDTVRLTVTETGNVGIGTTTPGFKLDVYGSIVRIDRSNSANGSQSVGLRQQFGSDAVLGSLTLDMGGYPSATGASRYAYIQAGDSAAFRSLVLQPSNGNVGIGTTSPVTKLDVQGSSIRVLNPSGNATFIAESIGGEATFAARNSTNRWNTGVNTSGHYFIYDETSGNVPFRIYPGASGGGTLTLNSGNVGIGTTTPAAKLSVETGTSGDGIYLKSTSSAINHSFRLMNDTGVYTNMFTVRSGGGSDAGKFFLQTNSGTTAMVVDTAQRIGIGTTTPASRLAVSGNMTIGANYNVAAPTNGLLVEGAVGTGVSSLGGINTQFYSSSGAGGTGTAAGLFYGSTNTGLFTSPSGSSRSNATLVVGSNYNSSSGTVLNVYSAIGDALLLVRADGNVGIGTASPASLLDLSSTLTAGGTASTTLRVSGLLNSNSWTVDQSIGGIDWYNNDASGSLGAGVRSYLRTVTTNVNGNEWAQVFGISANNAAVAERMRLTTTGLGIANTAPSVALDVTGDIEYTGTITDVSDRRLKENIQDIDGALSILSGIRGTTYNMIGSDRPEVGFIAQEVQAVLPNTAKVVDPLNGYLGVSYMDFIPYLVEGVNDLNIRTLSLAPAAQNQEAHSLAVSADASVAGMLTVSGTGSFAGTLEAVSFLTTADAGLPSEVLTAGQADLYKMARFAISEIQGLKERADLLAVRIDDIETRVAALEAQGQSATTTVAGAVGLTASTLKGALESFGIFIENGIAQFNTLVFRQLAVAKDEAGDSSAGSVSILAGNTVTQVQNPYVLPTSKVFVTFTSPVVGAWYISHKEAGSFRVTLAESQPNDVSFDYFILQTEGQLASPGAAGPSQQNQVPTPAPQPYQPVFPQDGGTTTPPTSGDTAPPSISLNGSAAIEVGQGGSWNDQGATASDETDGDLTSQIAVSGSVDTATPGLYTVSYSVSDVAGNQANVSRIITVTAAPQAPAPAPAPEPTPAPEPAPAPAPEPAPAPAP